jgi:hypothetical protein
VSQAGIISTTSGPVPPTVPTSFVTDSGTAVPAANILDVFGGETNINNDNGIRTIGSTNVLTIQLTNRITGTVTTTDATPTTLVSLSLGATPGVYLATGDLTAFDITDSAGASYTFEGAATTDGVTATEIGSEVRNEFESAAMTTADFSFGVTGNTAFIQVTGIAGKTINWSCLFNYRFVG